ncbi:unnamed protein product [Amoebophrya sp. A25]|nr:unnamed protein product [Amoebophrya sp. A25]|eukprot:GSA25T00016099001.1
MRVAFMEEYQKLANNHTRSRTSCSSRVSYVSWSFVRISFWSRLDEPSVSSNVRAMRNSIAALVAEGSAPMGCGLSHAQAPCPLVLQGGATTPAHPSDLRQQNEALLNCCLRRGKKALPTAFHEPEGWPATCLNLSADCRQRRTNYGLGGSSTSSTRHQMLVFGKAKTSKTTHRRIMRRLRVHTKKSTVFAVEDGLAGLSAAEEKALLKREEAQQSPYNNEAMDVRGVETAPDGSLRPKTRKAPLEERLREIRRLFPPSPSDKEVKSGRDLLTRFVGEQKRTVEKTFGSMQEAFSMEGLEKLVRYATMFMLKNQTMQTANEKMDIIMNPGKDGFDIKKLILEGPSKPERIRPPVHVTLAPAFEDMPMNGVFARPPSVDLVWGTPPFSWNTPIYQINPLAEGASFYSTTRGWPGTSGGPLGTLMPLPVGLNTQVIEARNYQLPRKDPFAHREAAHEIPLPFVDASQSRSRPDFTSKQMRGDQGLVTHGISQAHIFNRKIYDPDIF